MENKQQNYSRSSNVKTCQGSEVARKSSDTHLNKARRRDHSNSSRNDTTSRNSRQVFNSNNQKKNQGRFNNDKRPRPRGGGAACFGNNVDEGAPGGAECEGGEFGGNDKQDYTNGRNANRNGFRSGGYNAASNESNSGTNITSPGLANNTNLAISRHGKKFDYELNSVYAAGSKKQNLNHLLNFHYSPRDSANSIHDINFFGRGGSGFGSNNMQRNYNSRSKQHKYNKEQFLQANFQFVINNNAKPKFEGSPDTLIDWSLIEQINIQTTEEPQCPICLYPPMAAKITRCGHVYCWSCILHYLSLSDKNWRRCPICFEAIYGPDLKSCIILQQHHVTVGEQITFRLMRRRKGSLFIEPLVNKISSIEYYPQMGKADSLQRFSKFLIAKRSDVQEIIERERKELLIDTGENDLELEDEEAYADFVFVQQALSFCHNRMKQHGLLESVSSEVGDKIPQDPNQDKTDDDPTIENQPNTEERDLNTLVQLETVVEDNSEIEPVDAEEKVSSVTNELQDDQIADNLKPVVVANEADLESQISTDENINVGTPSTPTKFEKYHYFYQSDDGQNVYLHPLNIKMLQACYGSLDLAPNVITANVLQREQFSMDEEHRRRLVCLSHLPLTCECSFIEVDLQPPIVTTNVIKQFKDDVLYRRKIRQRREHEENKRERKINEFNDRQMGKLISSAANINISSPQEFPSCGFEERLPTANTNEPLPSSSPSSLNTLSAASRSSGNSYSNVAVFGEKTSPQQEAWPAMRAPKTAANYQELSTAWRRQEASAKNKASASSTATTSANIGNNTEESDPYLDDFELRPMSTNFGDVLAEAISQKKNNKTNKNTNAGNCSEVPTASTSQAIGNTSSNATNSGNNAGNRKKNKRSKKVIPIFATGMNYNGKD